MDVAGLVECSESGHEVAAANVRFRGTQADLQHQQFIWLLALNRL